MDDTLPPGSPEGVPGPERSTMSFLRKEFLLRKSSS